MFESNKWKMSRLGKYFGIVLMAVAFLGTLFFRHYTGQIISHPVLWYIGFVAVGLTGALLIFRSSSSEDSKSFELYKQTIAQLKASSRRVELIFDDCDFKNGSYSERIEDPDLSVLKAVIPHSLSVYMDSTKTVIKAQSYLIYTEISSGAEQRYVSYPFPFDKATLEYYIMTKRITLYVDRFDKRKYYFDVHE